MDPSLLLTGSVLVLAGVPVLLLVFADTVVRAAAVLRPRLPCLLRPLLGAAVAVAMVGRPVPAAATMPPPVMRVPLPSREAVPAPVVVPAPAVASAGAGAPPETVQAPPDTDPAAVREARAVPVVAGAEYTVVPGDSLWAIAARLLGASGENPSSAAVDRGWRAIYDANRSVIGPDPDLILPGQRLVIPAGA